jgi:hypothetical protein
MQKLPIGKSDFKTLRENNLYYVDKSGLIAEIINENNDVLLITRPRRFGKTLNLSMLECFFDIEGKGKGLFEDLKIAKMPEYKEHGKYPVVFLTLKDLTELDYKLFLKKMASIMAEQYTKYGEIIDAVDERIVFKEEVNRLQNKIIPILEDAKKVNVRGNRIIMNLPKYAHLFVDKALDIVEENGVIHYYTIGKDFNDAIELFKSKCECEILEKRIVKSYSPREYVLVLDIKVKKKK